MIHYYFESKQALISELQAGWYRYISEFWFHEDGTIEPRFKFSSVYNSCDVSLYRLGS